MRWAWLITLFSLSFVAWSSTPVTVKPLSEVVVYPELTAPATTVSLNDSQLSAEIDARIIDIPVLVGQRVKAGKVLLRLDCENYVLTLERSKAVLNALQARLEFAEYQYERARSLIANNSISEEVLVQRKTDLSALQADVQGQKSARRQAEIDVARCELRAPYDAIVTARAGQVGELARRGAPLLRLLETDNYEVTAKVRGEDSESLTSATNVSFITQGNAYPVKLRTVTPVLDTRERNRDARLRFTNAAALPGSAGKIKWRRATPHAPAHLLVRRNGQLGLFFLKNGTARFEALPHASEGRPAPVGLPLNTSIIIDGRHALQDGDTVSQ